MDVLASVSNLALGINCKRSNRTRITISSCSNCGIRNTKRGVVKA